MYESVPTSYVYNAPDMRRRSKTFRLLEYINFSRFCKNVMLILLFLLIAMNIVEAIYYGTASGRYLDNYMGIADIVFIVVGVPSSLLYLFIHWLADIYYTLWDKRLLKNQRQMFRTFSVVLCACALQTAFQLIMLSKYGIPFDLSHDSKQVYPYVSSNIVLATVAGVFVNRTVRGFPAFVETLTTPMMFEQKEE